MQRAIEIEVNSLITLLSEASVNDIDNVYEELSRKLRRKYEELKQREGSFGQRQILDRAYELQQNLRGTSTDNLKAIRKEAQMLKNDFLDRLDDTRDYKNLLLQSLNTDSGDDDEVPGTSSATLATELASQQPPPVNNTNISNVLLTPASFTNDNNQQQTQQSHSRAPSGRCTTDSPFRSLNDNLRNARSNRRLLGEAQFQYQDPASAQQQQRPPSQQQQLPFEVTQQPRQSRETTNVQQQQPQQPSLLSFQVTAQPRQNREPAFQQPIQSHQVPQQPRQPLQASSQPQQQQAFPLLIGGASATASPAGSSLMDNLTKDMCGNRLIRRYFDTYVDITKPEHFTRVKMQECYSPSLFFLSTDGSDKELEDIQTRIELHLRSNNFPQQQRSYPLGEFVLARFEHEMFRAVIINLQAGDTYRVLYVDYGNNAVVPCTDIRPIPRELSDIPMCVQQCYLDGIKPPKNENSWVDSTTQCFYDMASDEDVKITVTSVKSRVYGVKMLVRGQCVNDYLIESGCADSYTEQSSLGRTGDRLPLETSSVQMAPTRSLTTGHGSTSTARQTVLHRPGSSSSSSSGANDVGRPPSRDRATAGNTRHPAPRFGGDNQAAATGPAGRGSLRDYNSGTLGGGGGGQSTSSSDIWKRDKYHEALQGVPSLNFNISYTDLVHQTSSANINELAEKIDGSLFGTERKTIEAKRHLKKTRSTVPGEVPEGTEEHDYNNSNREGNTGVAIATVNAPSMSRDQSSTDVDIIDSPSSYDSVVDEEKKVLIKIPKKDVYNPNMYLDLGTSTIDEVCTFFKEEGRSVRRLEIERVSDILEPVVVTHADSPDYFCVALLNARNLNALEALNESLTVFYSDEGETFNPSDVCTHKGTDKQGVVVTVNKNLVRVKWEGSEHTSWVENNLLNKLNSTKSLKYANGCGVKFDVGDFCAAKFNDNTWYRAIILEIYRKRKTHKIYKYDVCFVDYGNVEGIDVRCIRPLPALYQGLPCQAIPCKMSEIVALPRAGSDGEEEEDDEEGSFFISTYPYESAKAFRDLVLEERVYVISRSPEGTTLTYEHGSALNADSDDPLRHFRSDTLFVSIFDKLQNSTDLINIAKQYANNGHADVINSFHDKGFTTCTITADELKNKIRNLEETYQNLDNVASASSIVLPSLGSDLSSMNESPAQSLTSWDPMTQDYNSPSNLVDHDVDDLNQAVFGEKLSNRKLCKFFSRGKVCYKGENCKFIHQKKTDFYSERNATAIDMENKINPPSHDMPIMVSVSSVRTPFHFWAQILPENIAPDLMHDSPIHDPLTALTLKMTSHYRLRGYKECRYYPAIGEIVAVKSAQGNDTFRRSRVVETDEVGYKKCEVFHLDYGTSEVVPESSLRVMDIQFIEELPYQCHEMFLADVESTYREPTEEPVMVGSDEISLREDEQRQGEAYNYFIEQVQNRWLVAKVVEQSPEGGLYVHLWNSTDTEDILINRKLVDKGFAKPLHPLPTDLNTDCSTLSSSHGDYSVY